MKDSQRKGCKNVLQVPREALPGGNAVAYTDLQSLVGEPGRVGIRGVRAARTVVVITKPDLAGALS